MALGGCKPIDMNPSRTMGLHLTQHPVQFLQQVSNVVDYYLRLFVPPVF
jgi:hypothetical protein